MYLSDTSSEHSLFLSARSVHCLWTPTSLHCVSDGPGQVTRPTRSFTQTVSFQKRSSGALLRVLAYQPLIVPISWCCESGVLHTPALVNASGSSFSVDFPWNLLGEYVVSVAPWQHVNLLLRQLYSLHALYRHHENDSVDDKQQNVQESADGCAGLPLSKFNTVNVGYSIRSATLRRRCRFGGRACARIEENCNSFHVMFSGTFCMPIRSQSLFTYVTCVIFGW